MRTVIILQGKFDPKQLDEFRDQVIVAYDPEAAKILEEAKISHKRRTDYLVPDFKKNATDFLNKWSNIKFTNGTIKQTLVYEDFSFWWCMEDWIYYSYLYQTPLRTIIESIDVVRTIITKEKPDQVAYVEDDCALANVIHLVTPNLLHKIIPAQKKTLTYKITEKYRPAFIKQIFRLHLILRKLSYLMNKSKKTKEQNSIIICTTDKWTKFSHPAFSEPVIGDPYVTPITAYIKDSYTYVDCTRISKTNFNSLKSKLKSNEKHILLEQHLKLKHFRKAREITREITQKVNKLMNDPLFIKSWKYNEVDLWPLIEKQFRSYFEHRIEAHILDYISTVELLENEKPKLVVYPCEGGFLGTIMFAACRNHKVPCIGIQHGTLSYSPLTIHLRNEMIKEHESLPLPTKLCVYGEYYAQFLIRQGNYPNDTVQPVGNIRFDNFINAKNTSKKEAKEKYCLPLEKPVVMYITQDEQLPDAVEITRTIFKAVKKLNVSLIVKQHPGESNDAFYQQIAQEEEITTVIVENVPTIEVLRASDVVIGLESTLDYEAMILDIPVIITNFRGEKNTLPFVNSGAAIGVFRPDEILPALNDALFNKQTKTKLSFAMNELVQSHCYKIDGKSAQRIGKIIEQLIKP